MDTQDTKRIDDTRVTGMLAIVRLGGSCDDRARNDDRSRSAMAPRPRVHRRERHGSNLVSAWRSARCWRVSHAWTWQETRPVPRVTRHASQAPRVERHRRSSLSLQTLANQLLLDSRAAHLSPRGNPESGTTAYQHIPDAPRGRVPPAATTHRVSLGDRSRFATQAQRVWHSAAPQS